MQVDTKHSHTLQVTLQHILRVIAADPEPARCVPSILDNLISTTGAAEAAFLLFDELHTWITAGQGDLLQQHRDNLESSAHRLASGIHTDPYLITTTDLPHTCVIAPIYLGGNPKGALCLLFTTTGHTLTDEHQQFVSVVLDGLAVVANTAEVHMRHELAHQLSMSLLTSISDPLIVLDENRRVLLLNPAAERVFQQDTLQARGQPLESVVQSDELVALIHQKNKNLIEWVNGDDLTFVPRIEAIHNSDGQIEGWVLALRDITRFKKLNRNQNEFTRIVSHDLRSPLTSMQGFASMLELGLVGDLNEKQKHFVEKILSGISQMTALVDNIQDAGRYDPETGFYEVNRSQCDLAEIINRITDTQLVPAEKQELALTVEIAPDLPIINADINMLERAVTNLVDNAIKYTPNGGRVDIRVQRHGDDIHISVRDTGLGVSPENQKHLFERHRRIAREEHKRIKGSGLGLFIVKSVAQRHGGDAWVESMEGKGSTFYMSIPLSGSNLISGEEVDA